MMMQLAIFQNINLYIIMYSDSESVRQTFAYPSQQLPTMIGENSGKSLNRRPRQKKPPIKDQIYFKLKVLKHVGQLISNLKSSIALISHDLSEQQMSYLQSSEQHYESDCLLRQDNFIILFTQSILWVVLWIILWKSSFEMVFQRLSSSIYINMAAIIVYICYLLVYFNSKLRNQRQQLITVRSVIIKSYFKQRFPQVIPFLISTFIDATFEPSQSSFLYYFVRLIPIMLFAEISILYKNLENSISSQNKGEILIMFAKLLGKIMLFLHFISLILNIARNIQFKLGYNKTWVEQYKQTQNFNGGELYLLGWYWGSTILCTVGFGDIVPANNLQRALISFLEVFSALIFGYFVNYIGHLIKMQGQKTDLFESNLRKLNRYLSKTKIPGSLKREARAHFFDREQIVKTYNQEQQEQILGNLNTNIKKDILEYSNIQVLKGSFLAKLLNSQILKSIAFKMRKLIYAPEQTIYSPDDQSAERLWIIEKGKVVDRWYSGSGKSGKNIAIYTQGVQQNILGWINFLKNETYKLTAKSETFSILHEISRQDFIAIIKENRPNFLKLMEYKDHMVLSSRKYVFRCLCCQRLSHSTVDCPKIHLPKRSAHFLFGRLQTQILFNQQDKRTKKCRRMMRTNWKYNFGVRQFDPNQSKQVDQIEPESINNLTLSPRKSIKRKPSEYKQRHSVDQVIEFAKQFSLKCSMKLIQKQEQTSNKRLSSKVDIMSQCASNKNLAPEPLPEEFYLKNFDRYLQDEQGYFEASNISRVIQRIQSKSEGRKKRMAP